MPRYHVFLIECNLLPFSPDCQTGGKLFISFITEMLFDSFCAALPKHLIDRAGLDPTSTALFCLLYAL